MEKSGRQAKKNIGIWIDHKEAILVSMDGSHSTVSHIPSNADSHFRPSGGWKSSGTSVAQSVSKEQKASERFKHQLHQYYQSIIKAVGKASNIFIFGPGEAKGELAQEIENLKDQLIKIAGIKASDRLTENQIIAEVKTFFSEKQQ